jgi:hypothetical protein
MERYRWRFQDRAFFERFEELSDKQIRVYLGMRRAGELVKNPEVIREAQEVIAAGEFTIGIEQFDLIADIELLCEKGLILRERTV